MRVAGVMLQQCHHPDTKAPARPESGAGAPPAPGPAPRSAAAVDRGRPTPQIKAVCGAASAGRELTAPDRAGGSSEDAALARNPEEDVRT